MVSMNDVGFIYANNLHACRSSPSQWRVGRTDPLLARAATTNPYAARTVYIRLQANFRPIKSTRITQMLCGRCLVSLIITFWRRIFLHKYYYFSSFGAGNCVSNSSFKWMKNSLKKIGSIRAEAYPWLTYSSPSTADVSRPWPGYIYLYYRLVDAVRASQGRLGHFETLCLPQGCFQLLAPRRDETDK